MREGAGIKCIEGPPIELYERIKGFAVDCHKAVNQRPVCQGGRGAIYNLKLENLGADVTGEDI